MTAAPSSRRRALAQNLIVSLSVSAGLIAALEVTCRLLEKKPAASRQAVQEWKAEAPGEHFYTMSTDNAGWPPWQEFNRDGLRDRRHSVQKPAGRRRLAFLGDSVTAGIGLAPEEAYPRVLEARLHAEGVPVDVMNVALWGWSTRQQRIAYRRIVRKYAPDEVVVAICLNDIQELEHQLARPPAFLVALHERSALVRRVVGAQRREVRGVEELVLGRRGFDQFFAELRALRDEVQADGTRFAAIVFPYRFQVEATAPPAVAQEKIAAFCRSESIPLFDLLPALRPVGPVGFIDDNHLSAEGSRRVVDALLAGDLLTRPTGYAARLRPIAPADRPRALVSAEPTLRRAAIWALGRTPGADVTALAALRAALRDADPGVVWEAERALGAWGRAAAEALPDLLLLLDHAREDVRAQAARSIWSIGLDADHAPALLAHFRSQDEYVRQFAVWAAGQLGTAGHDAVPALLTLLASEEGHAAGPAAVALRRLAASDSTVVRVLAHDLTASDSALRARAARSLGKLGPVAAGAVPDLVRVLADPQESPRAEATIALGRIEAPAAVPALVERLRRDEGWVREEAARALGRIGPPAHEAIPDLMHALRNDEPAVRRQAARALGRMGASGRLAVPALKTATRDSEETVQEEARKALEAVGAP